MPDLVDWLDLHSMRLQQGLRGAHAYPISPLVLSPGERALFRLAEDLAEALRPVEPPPAWVASLYERLLREARRPAPRPGPSRSWWWVGAALGTMALGLLAYQRLHRARPV